MRATRLLQLLHLLAARGRMSASELASALDVTPRTIYRDIETLSSAGFPVFAEQGPTGGYELLADFRSPFVVLTPDEISMLVRLGPPASAADLGLAPEVDHAYTKLAVALTKAARTRHRQLVLVDAPRWFRDRRPPAELAALADAVTHHRRVRTSVRGQELELEPLGLVDKAGTWYVVAIVVAIVAANGAVADVGVGGDLRAHRVDRLGPVVATGARFEPPAGFDLARFWATWTDDFESSRPSLEVEVEVAPAGVEELPKALGEHVGRLLADAEPDRRGRRRITVPFFSPEAAVHHLTGAGHLVRVLAPDTIRSAVRDRAASALAVQDETASATGRRPADRRPADRRRPADDDQPTDDQPTDDQPTDDQPTDDARLTTTSRLPTTWLRSGGVVEDDPERVPTARAHDADPVAHGHVEPAPPAADRAIARREHDAVTTRERRRRRP